MNTDTDCLLCQAKIARASYELEDCYDLIDDLARELRKFRDRAVLDKYLEELDVFK